MTTDILGQVTLRSAQGDDVAGIVALVNDYAAEAIMLYRTPKSVRLSLHDFIGALTATGAVVACAANCVR